MKRYFFLICILFCSLFVFSQDTLPRFTVSNAGNDINGNARIIISWVNQLDSLRQISIQTSHDSLKNYRTIISLTDPNARTNGFADKKAPNDHMYYRLFVVKNSGDYFFTSVKRPSLDTLTTIVLKNVPQQVKKTESRRNDFTPSFYVYTNKDGYVFINLPDAERNKYRIKFYDEANDFIFELKAIKQPALTLDKTNFMHGGWYQFELFNDDKLVEKHKLFLSKEF